MRRNPKWMQYLGGGFVPTSIAGNTLWLRGDLGISTPLLEVNAANEFETWPTFQGATIDSTNEPDPFGGTTARFLKEDTSTVFHSITGNISGPDPGAFSYSPTGNITFSLYAKYYGRRYLMISNVISGTVVFDLVGGAIVSELESTGTITAVGDDWYFCTMTWSSPNPWVNAMALYMSQDGVSTAYTGDGVSGVALYTANVETDTPNVSAWADQSGTGDPNKNAVQATEARQPLYSATDPAYNNKPSLAFVAAGPRFLVSDVWSVAPTTVGTMFVVGNFGATGVEVMVGLDGALAYFYINAANDLRYYQGADLLAVGEATTGSKHVYCVVRNGANSQIYQDSTTALVTGNAGGGALNRCILGSYTTAGGAPLDGKIVEVIDYNRVLNAAEIAAVFRYLRVRYAI